MTDSDGLQAKIAESLFTAVNSLHHAKLLAECEGELALRDTIQSALSRTETCELLNASIKREEVRK